jgi:hypothetical protein
MTCRLSIISATHLFGCTAYSFKYIGHSFIRKFYSIQGAITHMKPIVRYSSRQQFGNSSNITCITVIPSGRTVELFRLGILVIEKSIMSITPVLSLFYSLSSDPWGPCYHGGWLCLCLFLALDEFISNVSHSWSPGRHIVPSRFVSS